jgi:integrase
MGKCGAMQWDDLEDGVWHIRPDKRLANREKGTAGSLPLSPQAMAVVNAQHRFAHNKHVFAGRDAGPFAAISQAKRALDGRLADALAGAGCNTRLEPWKTHDLRRTARSLMSRAGVTPHIAEITLGHVQKGIIQVYDRHSYTDEKREAIAALGNQVEQIISGRA